MPIRGIVRSQFLITIDDGPNEAFCTPEEAAVLWRENLILPCPDDCEKGTFHLAVSTFGEVEERLKELRSCES